MPIALHIPSVDELGYRQDLLFDPATMSYNRHEAWVGVEPRRFYAYIRREDGAFVGEVCLHQDEGRPYHDMDVVVEGRWRGHGYGHEALRLLVAHAFDHMDVEAIHNCFEESRSTALKLHLDAGFKVVSRHDGLVELLLAP